MGKKLTVKQLKAIQREAKKIRENGGYKSITVKKYKIGQREAVKRGARKVLHRTRQGYIRFKD
ncbi:MAG: hypothetical protein LBB53_01510 [Prevotellaceae bacterium]|jgi:hypothetical protein|nr:hypothetical protein [Prevotellaceae bacterium]